GSTTQWKGAHRVYVMGITFLSTATKKSNRPWAGFIFWIAGAEEKLRGCAGSTTQWKGAHRVYVMGITFLSTATKNQIGRGPVLFFCLHESDFYY
ncbi:MAG: hypothetical protein K2L94_01625, partial [Alphaproteobacteria bacterium]|nr:hypothetical protein [Alphaproteobacteria bacterium]